MEFIKTTDPTKGAVALQKRIQNELANDKRVLWLISGGSAINSEADILKNLRQTKDASKLTVMLMDERYGPAGHTDSNWLQLLQAGADFRQASGVPVMSKPAQSLEKTATNYSEQIALAMKGADIIIGLFGLGPDRHTAGILPYSPATIDTSDLVVFYKTPQFDRITLTRHALLRVNVGYVFAFGEAKLPALKDLQSGKKTFKEVPASLLYELPEAYIYNDQIGETK